MDLKTREINGKSSQKEGAQGPGAWGSRPSNGALPTYPLLFLRFTTDLLTFLTCFSCFSCFSDSAFTTDFLRFEVHFELLC